MTGADRLDGVVVDLHGDEVQDGGGHSGVPGGNRRNLPRCPVRSSTHRDASTMQAAEAHEYTDADGWPG